MSALSDKQLLLAGAAVLLAGGLVIWQGRKAAAATVDAVGGAVSGNNALTKGTSYEGKGVLGTLGAGADAALAGAPSRVGQTIGGWIGDIFDNYDPNDFDSKMGMK